MSHKAIVATGLGQFSATTLTTPTPKGTEVLIKVHYAAYGAFDNHQLADGLFAQYPQVLGLTLAGEVESVGPDVESALAVGDKVLAHTFPGSDRAIQEYVIADKYAVAKLPSNITPEEGASVPDNLVTAWWTISNCLKLPLPTSIVSGSNAVNDPATSEPILIWGAGTSAAQYMLQVLKLAGYKHVIATASKRSAPTALELGATHVIDYNDPEASEKIKQAAGGKPIKRAVDCVSFINSLEQIAKVVAEGCKVAPLLPIKLSSGGSSQLGGGHEYVFELAADKSPFKQPVELVLVSTFGYSANVELKENLMPKILPALLENKLVKPAAIRLISSGSLLERVAAAAALYKSNALGGDKAILKIPA